MPDIPVQTYHTDKIRTASQQEIDSLFDDFEIPEGNVIPIPVEKEIVWIGFGTHKKSLLGILDDAEDEKELKEKVIEYVNRMKREFSEAKEKHKELF